MHPQLRQLIDRLQSDPTPDWNAYRQEISNLSKVLQSEGDRVALLSVYKVLMDLVEQQIGINDLHGFQEARLKEYRLFLVEEAVDGGEVDPSKLDHITKREVAAGRLAADDDLRELGQIGGTFLAQKRPPPRKGGLLARLFGRFVRVTAD